jgi:hypothetical protein
VLLDLLSECSEGEFIDADLSVSGRLGFLSRVGAECSLSVSGKRWFSWEQPKLRQLHHLRWQWEDQVVLWPIPAESLILDEILACSAVGQTRLQVGFPRDVVGGRDICFVSYGEDQHLRAADDEIASQMIAAFDTNGKLVFGLKNTLNSGIMAGTPTEARFGCIASGNDGIFCFHGCDGLWRVSPLKTDVRKIPAMVDVNKITALSEHNGKIFFSTSATTGLIFGELDPTTGKTRERWTIPIAKLGKLAPLTGAPDQFFRVHGCPGGIFLITTKYSIWRVQFS